MEAVETKRIGKYEIQIIPDSDPESPREWDNLGTMICQHRRYNLGDKHNYDLSNCGSWFDIQKAKEVLEAEVKVYDQYITREVYGFKIYEISTCDHGHEHKEEIDSCWSYYGYDECEKEADYIVKSLIKHDQDVEQTRYP
jgi:hypothetical protein